MFEDVNLDRYSWWKKEKTQISVCLLYCMVRGSRFKHINFYHLPQDLAHEMFREILPWLKLVYSIWVVNEEGTV